MAKRKRINQAQIPKRPGGVNVVVREEDVEYFLNKNKPFRDDLINAAKEVVSKAEATASDAEEGPGGRIDGYAAAGFSYEWESRPGSRPRVNIKSNADTKTMLAAHFHTQLRDGVGHLRAALYSVTNETYEKFTGKYKYNRWKGKK